MYKLSLRIKKGIMSTPENDNTDSQTSNHENQVPNGYELKKKKPFYKRWWFILLAIVVIILIIAGINSGGDDNDSNSGSGTSSSADSENSGDADLQFGEAANMDGLQITVSNPQASGADALGESHVCTQISVDNNSDKDVDIHPAYDFKMTDPNNVEQDMSFSGDTDLKDATVKQGGSMSGQLCFDGDGAPGNYEVTYKPSLSLSTNEAHWKGQL